MEGCLRAVPEFVARHPQGDPATEEMTVPVASGPLKLVLSGVVEGSVRGAEDEGGTGTSWVAREGGS